MQTLLGHFLRNTPLPTGGEELVIPLPDGDFLLGTLFRGSSNAVIYLFHGISSDTNAGYMARSARVCLAHGHTVFMVNHRGCGAGQKLYSSKPYHSGRAEDLSAAIQAGKKLFPERRHIAIGFSMSGNALLLLASGTRGEILPDAAISFNAPINLDSASRNLTRNFNRLYDLVFFLQARKEIGMKLRKRWITDDIKLPLLSTIRELDESFTAPQAGFSSREEYYEQCSAGPRLSRIKIPTVMITSKDDPFVDYEEYLKAELSPLVYFHATDRGGHMGYVSAASHPQYGNHWMDLAVRDSVDFLLTPALE